MSQEIRIATESDLRQCIKLDTDAIDCVEAAFAALAGGDVVMPPVLSMALPDKNAEVDIKTAYVPGFGGFAIKVSPGFFNNPALGLPSLNGLMVLLSADTGLVQAVFLDNGYLTDVRTAAAGAVASRHLAPQDVEALGILGTGLQAELQAKAACMVRKPKKIFIWGRSPAKAEILAKRLAMDLDIAAEALPNADDVVRRSALVVTTTPSTTPLFSADALHPGLHITAMGSDQDGKNEIVPDVLAAADLIVCDRISQCERMGEVRTALTSGLLPSTERLVELGDVITAKTAGRPDENAITICDLTGTGVQDTAIATLAFGRIEKAGLGTPFAV